LLDIARQIGHPSADMSEAPKKRRFSRLITWPMALFALLVFLALEAGPDTKAVAPPDASEVRMASDSFDRLRQTLKANEARDYEISEAEMNAALTLAARTRGISRTKASISADAIDVQISTPFRLGLWLNAKAHIAASKSGFPEISARIGDLPIPAFLCKLIIKLYWDSRDADMPLLNELAQKLALEKGMATATVKLPKSGSLLNTLGDVRANPVDAQLVSKIYCGLSKQQKATPSASLTDHVNRAFDGTLAPGGNAVERNRAAFVALAMLVADRRIGEVTAGLKLKDTASCKLTGADIALLDRADLAKHWAVSSALTAAFGPDLSHAMGTWKEISDSGRGGSGFSFVDLAADRSGLFAAKQAIDPEKADATARRLARISEAQLLPLQALALSEGLSEAEFQSRFVHVETPAYKKTVARIDRILADSD
jgi:uncharacterized protein YfiM (DUF2279 family)